MDDIFSWDAEDEGSYSDDIQSFDDLPILQGDGNSPPVQSDTMPQGGRSILDTLGGMVGNISQYARDLGTAVGQVQRDVKGADDAFKGARDAQLHGSNLSTWWQYTSTTDKVMIGLAALGVGLVLWKGNK